VRSHFLVPECQSAEHRWESFQEGIETWKPHETYSGADYSLARVAGWIMFSFFFNHVFPLFWFETKGVVKKYNSSCWHDLQIWSSGYDISSFLIYSLQSILTSYWLWHLTTVLFDSS
jgi:hypothetical protein